MSVPKNHFYDSFLKIVSDSVLEWLPQDSAPKPLDETARKEIAAMLAMDVLDRARDVWGGQQLYFPVGDWWAKEVEQRWIDIFLEASVDGELSEDKRRALAKKWGLTDKYLSQVINKGRRLYIQRVQMPLF